VNRHHDEGFNKQGGGKLFRIPYHIFYFIRAKIGDNKYNFLDNQIIIFNVSGVVICALGKNCSDR